MGTKNRTVGIRVRLSEAGRARVQPLLPTDKIGEALYAAVAELREAPSRDTVARILDPERRHGVNYDTLVQFFLALDLTVPRPIGSRSQLYIPNVKNDEEYIEAAQQGIGNVRDALVVVHNLAFPLELKNAFRHGIGGRLLVTTTNPRWLWKDLEGRHVVPPLDITDAARYLRLKSGRDATNAEAEDLADMLRGLPGDLEQVAVALQLEPGLSWTGQAEELRHRNLNFARQYGALQALLRASLFLANEPVPVAFAQQYCKLRQADWQQTLHHLDRRALICWDRTKAEYTITPSIRAMEWAVVPEGSRPSLALGTCKVLEKVFPTPKNTTWPICERLILHALECAHHVETYGLKGKEMGTLLYRAYLSLCQRHRYIEAIPLLERVEARLRDLQLTEPAISRSSSPQATPRRGKRSSYHLQTVPGDTETWTLLRFGKSGLFKLQRHMEIDFENEYILDRVSSPGETLKEVLDERRMPQTELADRLGLAHKTVNEIIRGKAPLRMIPLWRSNWFLAFPQTFGTPMRWPIENRLPA